MKYYWIVNWVNIPGGPEVVSGHCWDVEYIPNAVGPYFSYKEAMECLYKWTK